MCVIEDEGSGQREDPAYHRAGLGTAFPQETQAPFQWRIENNVIWCSQDEKALIQPSRMSEVVVQNTVSSQESSSQNTGISKQYGNSESMTSSCSKNSVSLDNIGHKVISGYKCNQCYKIFKYPSKLAAHHRGHTGERPFSCPECDKTFVRKEGLIRHQKTHKEDSMFNCSLCGKGFNTRSRLYDHQASHTTEKQFGCEECGKRFIRHFNLAQHKRKHKQLYSCSDCEKHFNNYKVFMRHQKTHSNRKNYKCSECGESFQDNSSLVKHQRTHNEKDVENQRIHTEDPQLKKTPTEEQPCFWELCLNSPSDCSKQIQNCGESCTCELGTPIPQEKQAPFRWTIEDNVIWSFEDGKAHIQPSRMSEVVVQNTVSSPESCCQNTDITKQNENPGFITSSNSRNSVSIDNIGHKVSSGYKCNHCHKIFKYPSKLAAHHRGHTGERPFSCPECDKTFVRKEGLIRHQKTHKEDSMFNCSLCGKVFNTRSRLYDHQASHTAEKPFGCEECGRRFIRYFNLAQHRRKHKQLGLYNCSCCGKQFTSYMILMRHQKIHSNKKDYKCSECGGSFQDRASLIEHQGTHTEENVKNQKVHTEEPKLQKTHTEDQSHSGEFCLNSSADCSKQIQKCGESCACGKCKTDSLVQRTQGKLPLPDLIIHNKDFSVRKPQGRPEAGETQTCSECGKNFLDNACLLKHLKTHTRDQPYACLECGRRFARRLSFDNHTKTHKKLFICTECGESFFTYPMLVEHRSKKTSSCYSLLPSVPQK
ncbi:uncharacterized protein WCC33_014505 [Rhinophrynus dorsalis]